MRLGLAFAQFLLLAFGLPVCAQDGMDYVKPITDAWQRARELGMRQRIAEEQLKLQRQQLELQRQQLGDQRQREELERLRSEADRTRQGAGDLTPSTVVSLLEERRKIGLLLDKALSELRVQYPDFGDYEKTMLLLANDLTLNNGSGLPIKHYLESLYVIAKYASFAKPIAEQKAPLALP